MVGRTSNSFQNKNIIVPGMETEKSLMLQKYSNGDDKIPDVCNEHNTEQVPDTKRGKYQNCLLTDDDISLSM